MKNLKINYIIAFLPLRQRIYVIKRNSNLNNKTVFELIYHEITDSKSHEVMSLNFDYSITNINWFKEEIIIKDLNAIAFIINPHEKKQRLLLNENEYLFEWCSHYALYWDNSRVTRVFDLSLQTPKFEIAANLVNHKLSDDFVISYEISQIELRKIENGELLWQLDISSLGYYLSQGEQHKEAVDTILGVSSSDELILATKGHQLVFISCQTGRITHIINKSLGVRLTEGVFDPTNRYLHFFSFRHYVQIDTHSKNVIKRYEVDFKDLEVYSFTMTGSFIAFTANYPGRSLARNVVGVYNTVKNKTEWIYEVQLAKRASFINKYKPVYHEGRVLVIDSDDTLHIISP